MAMMTWTHQSEKPVLFIQIFLLFTTSSLIFMKMIFLKVFSLVKNFIIFFWAIHSVEEAQKEDQIATVVTSNVRGDYQRMEGISNFITPQDVLNIAGDY